MVPKNPGEPAVQSVGEGPVPGPSRVGIKSHVQPLESSGGMEVFETQNKSFVSLKKRAR